MNGRGIAAALAGFRKHEFLACGSKHRAVTRLHFTAGQAVVVLQLAHNQSFGAGSTPAPATSHLGIWRSWQRAGFLPRCPRFDPEYSYNSHRTASCNLLPS